MNKEDAVKRIAELVESVQGQLKELTDLADEHELAVQVFDEWDNYLHYYPRPWRVPEDPYDEGYREDGGWYHSTC